MLPYFIIEKFMDLKEKLKEDMGPAAWEDLNVFVKRGTLFLLDGEHDLLETGYRIASDDSAFIKELIESQKIIKMDHETFNNYTQKKFVCLIVDPFVIFQTTEDNV